MAIGTAGQSLLSLHETSLLLNVHPNTLRRWDEQGILRAVRFGQRKDRHYSPDDVEKFMKLSVSIKKNKTTKHKPAPLFNYDEIVQRFRQLEQVASLLNRLDTIDVISEQLAGHMALALGATTCVVFVPDGKSEHLVHFSTHGYPQYLLKKWKRISYTANMPSAVAARDSVPVALGNRDEIERSFGRVRNKPFILKDTLSYIALPMICKAVFCGVMSIGFSKPREFKNEDVQFFMTLARQAAGVIDRGRLYQQQIDSRQAARDHSTFIRAINDAAIQFLIPSTPEETYKTIIEEAKKLTSCKYGSIFLWQGDRLSRIYSSFPMLKDIKPRRNGWTYTTFYNRKPAVYHIKNGKEPHPELNELGIKSVIYVPLHYESRIIGVMSVLSQNYEKWSTSGLDYLDLFGRLASLAIHKTQLYFETNNTLENQRLFLSIASHEIKSPLSTINGYLQILERGAKKTEAEKEIIMHRLSEETKRLNQMVNEFLGPDGSQLLPQGYNWGKCSIRKLIENAKDDFSFLYPSHRLTIADELGDDDFVRGDFDKLMQVFVNIFGNAGKYSKSGSKITIKLQSKKGYIKISVKDSGRGIPPQDLSNIFHKFYRADVTEKGMGLGLYLVRTIVENHDGKISIDSEVNRGTTVTVMLPTYARKLPPSVK